MIKNNKDKSSTEENSAMSDEVMKILKQAIKKKKTGRSSYN